MAVSSAEIAQSQEIQSVLNYGANQIIQIGVQQRKFPASNYSISQVVSVSRLSSKSGNTYKCSIEMTDSNKVLIKAAFTISYVTATQAQTMTGYSFGVSNLPA